MMTTDYNSFAGVEIHFEFGLPVLVAREKGHGRRVMYTNSYGGRETLARIQAGLSSSNHLWGCIELARMGYEVALAEPLPDFCLRRNGLPHDFRLFKPMKQWLGNDGVLYCGHNVLYWAPLFKKLGYHRSRIVSLLFAREPLNQASGHDGVIALTPVALETAKQLAPLARHALLAWGCELGKYPRLDYNPVTFLSCGLTHRDHKTLYAASQKVDIPIKIIAPRMSKDLSWPPHVQTLTTGQHDDTVRFQDLLREYYGTCIASLIILKYDPVAKTAVGFTNLIEAMAMARPVIVTRTGALPSQIDVEGEKCGLFVPAEDPNALAEAMIFLQRNPDKALAMGDAGRRLVERYYNMERYSHGLHDFFQQL